MPSAKRWPLCLHRSRLWRWWRCVLLFLCLCPLVLLWSQDGVQRIAFLAGAELHDAFVLDVLDEPFQDLASQVGAGHLAAAEEDGRFDLVAFSEEAQHVIPLGFVIVIVHIDAELHFLDHDLLLMLLGFALLLFLLVQEFPVVHDAANGGLSGGRDFNQVQVLFAGHLERFVGRQDPDLVAFVIDHADFARANAIVGADKALIDTILRTLPAESGVKIIAWALRASNDGRICIQRGHGPAYWAKRS